MTPSDASPLYPQTTACPLPIVASPRAYGVLSAPDLRRDPSQALRCALDVALTGKFRGAPVIHGADWPLCVHVRRNGVTEEAEWVVLIVPGEFFSMHEIAIEDCYPVSRS